MAITLHWFLPTNGDSRTDLSLGNAVGGAGSRADAFGADRAPDLDYLSLVAGAAEKLGFESAGRIAASHLRSVRALSRADGVIDSCLPGGNRSLGVDWALQNPADYLAVLHKGIPAVLAQAQADARDVIGIGVDFTSCTVLPVSADGRAL